MGTRAEHITDHEKGTRLVLDSEVSEIRLLLQKYAGVLIDRPPEVLAAMLDDFLVSHHVNSAAELIGSIRTCPKECESLLELVLAADTGFFHKREAFESLQHGALPAMRARKSTESPRPLRIWSAGCGSGEEAYSIGMSVCEALQQDNAGWNVHIVAGDIRREALKTAERGLYPSRTLLDVPAHLVAGYFSRVGDHLLVKPRLRNLVTFAWMNLVEPAFIGRFDCIFCLDVLPHLSAAGRTAVLQRLHLALEPGGYIFLGEGEHFPADANLIRHGAPGYTYYQRPLAAAARAGR